MIRAWQWIKELCRPVLGPLVAPIERWEERRRFKRVAELIALRESLIDRD